jgi:hypothetical protein
MKSATPLHVIVGIALVLSAAAYADSENTKSYVLKNRSSFHANLDARMPFWPIGYKRPLVKADGTTDAPVTTAKIQLLPEHFSVTSVLLGNPALATINGRSFEEGETLPVIYGNERLRVVVRAIRDGGITLDYEAQQIFVPMKRPELGAKQAQQKADPTEFIIKIGPSVQK